MNHPNHRERVLSALNHQETDRIPIDFGAMRSTGIHFSAYVRLKKYLGFDPGRPKVYDLMQNLAEPEREIIEYFDADVVQLHRLYPSFGVSIDAWKEGLFPDGEKCMFPKEFNPVVNEKGDREIIADGKAIARMPKDGFWFDFSYFPLDHASKKEDIDAFPFYQIGDREIKFLRNQIKELKVNYPDYAILGAYGGNVFEEGHYQFGYEEYLSLLLENPILAEYFNEKNVEFQLKNLKKYLDVVGDDIDIIQFGDDLGTQTAPYISPKLYRKIIKPYHLKLYETVHHLKPKLKVFLHSCGSIYEIIPDLIEIGVDILNPVQTTAANMDPIRLKTEFGKDLVFWGGGVETQKVMHFGTPEEVRKQVRERIDIFASGGGFVFTQIHNILPDIKPENIVAAYEETHNYRINE